MRKFFGAVVAVGLVTASLSSLSPATAQNRIPLKNVSNLAIKDGSLTEVPIRSKVDPALRTSKGKIRVVVQLSDAPLSIFNGAGFKQLSRMGANRTTAQAQRAHVAGLVSTQDALASQASALGAVTTHKFTKALNAVVMSVDASRVDALAALPGVASIRGVNNYELALSETVPYIGAKAVQTMGFDGSVLWWLCSTRASTIHMRIWVVAALWPITNWPTVLHPPIHETQPPTGCSLRQK